MSGSKYNDGFGDAMRQQRVDFDADAVQDALDYPKRDLDLIGPAHPNWAVEDRRKPEPERLNVLDKGYVRLVDSMGSDLSVVNAARVSYDKESHEFDEKDSKLVRFLVRENHTAPFRHAILSFETYAPLFVARQWWKHIIGGTQDEYPDLVFPGLDPFLAWNESSRRYVTENEEFYIPSMTGWRTKPDNNKQGSGAENLPAYVDEEPYRRAGDFWTNALVEYQTEGLNRYREAMEQGVAPEQARLFLPANGLYVRWRWTTSLQGAMHFIALRDESHAQWEIQEYARAVKELARAKFPVCIGGLDV